MVQVWEKVLQSRRQHDTLWDLYIAFRKCNFSSFSVSAMVSIYTKAMVELQHRKDQCAAGMRHIPDTANRRFVWSAN
jgi:hypothetical protein